VYVEVVNYEDDCWVFPAPPKNRWDRELDGPVELTRYLEPFFESGLDYDSQANLWKEGGERRNIQVGIVAYVELDDEGRVKAERTAGRERWWPYRPREILSLGRDGVTNP
jgi:hypothetical protein